LRLRLDIDPNPPAADLQLIGDGLEAHALQSGVEPRNYQTLTVVLRDENGGVVGGLVANTVWGWLHVKELWVATEHRRAGHGAELMRAVEHEARRRGCHHAMLDTFDFQARGFYERLGYVVFGALDDFPRGHTRFFMQKALVAEVRAETQTPRY
jgi:GNAT superfamily N-acetyltransferase